MRSSLCWILILPILASAARAEGADQLKARLAQAEANTSLYATGLKPWHLRAAVQIFDTKGANPQDATIEEWWAGPHNDRITYTSSTFTGTYLQTAQGDFSTAGMDELPVLMRNVHESIVEPMADLGALGISDPHEQTLTFGKQKLDCIVPMEPAARNAILFQGSSLTFCSEMGSGLLRMTLEPNNQVVVRNGVGTFQGKAVSTELAMSVSGARKVLAKVNILTTISDAAIDHSTTGLQPVDSAKLKTLRLLPGDSGSQLLMKVAPHYPGIAKLNHTSGDVILHVIVGTDGHVRVAEVVSSPSPGLGEAALEGVRQWIYRPYLVNGHAVEVDTTAEVKFRIG